MAIKSKTKHTSAIKLAAISIIVLCVFAGCKDDEKPDPDPKPKIAQWDSTSLDGTCWSYYIDSKYPVFWFDNGRMQQKAGTSITTVYDTTYSYEYPNVHIHSIWSDDEIYIKGVVKKEEGQWCIFYRQYLQETDEPLANVDLKLYLINKYIIPE